MDVTELKLDVTCGHCGRALHPSESFCPGCGKAAAESHVEPAEIFQPPNFGYGQVQPAPKFRVWWKLSICMTLLVLGVMGWQFYSAMTHGREQADAAVRHFHEQLNAGQYEEIFRESDEGITGQSTSQAFAKFLTGANRKLGKEKSEVLAGVSVFSNATGAYITAAYKTEFERGTAIETFVFQKSGNSFTLHGYNIQSSAFTD